VGSLRRATGVLTAGLLVGGWRSRWVRERRAEIERVHPDLRGPLLWVPLSITSRRQLSLLRPLGGLVGTPEAVPGVEVRTVAVPRPDGSTVSVLLFDPVGRHPSSGAVLWIHGGGFIAGNPQQSTKDLSARAIDVGALIASVDYRLAPEHPFPAGLDDCVAALRWLVDQADELGIDAARVAVGGESAGGGLAAALCQRALDDGGPAISGQVLVYPMLDDRTALTADHGSAGVFAWTHRSNHFAWECYLDRPISPEPTPDHAVSARRTDLTGLPPAWIGVGELDLFHEEDVEYAARLETAGVPCELHVVPGMYHGADGLRSGAPLMADFERRIRAAIRSAIAAESPATTPAD
jgi:acetyl esterase/lipase